MAKLKLTPRPYQTQAITTNVAAVGNERGLLNVMATGVGKTLCYAGVYTEVEKKVLVLCERQHLVEQQALALESYTAEPWDIEMGDRRPGGHYHGDVGARGIVASMQSLQQARRLMAYDPWRYDVVNVDEAHHAAKKNKGYQVVLDHFAKNQRLLLCGWTAWPVRGDKVGLGDYFPKLGHVLMLRDAIDDGWLVEPKQRYIALGEIEWEKIRRSTHGEFSPEQLAEAMDRTELVHKGVVTALQQLGDRPTIWFCASVEHAEHVTDAINTYITGTAVAVHGGSQGRYPPKVRPRLAKRAFRSGHYQHVVGCDALIEGYDEPRIRAVVIFRPVRRFGRYLQMIGRGSRLLDMEPSHEFNGEFRRCQIAASAKPDYLVLDVMGATLEHKHRPVDLCDVLIPGAFKPLREKVRKDIADGKAESILLSEMEHRLRLEKDRKLRMSVKAKKVDHATIPIDMWEDKPHQGGAQRKKASDKPSWPVLKTLRAAGIETAGLSKKESQFLYAQCKLEEAGRVGDGQRKLLEKYGENPDGWTPWKASILIDLIKCQGWRKREFALTRDVWRMRPTPEGWRIVIVEKKATGGVREYIVGPRFHEEVHARRVISQCLETPEKLTIKADLFA